MTFVDNLNQPAQGWFLLIPSFPKNKAPPLQDPALRVEGARKRIGRVTAASGADDGLRDLVDEIAFSCFGSAEAERGDERDDYPKPLKQREVLTECQPSTEDHGGRLTHSEDASHLGLELLEGYDVGEDVEKPACETVREKSDEV